MINTIALDLWKEHKSTKSKPITKRQITKAENILKDYPEDVQLTMVKKSIKERWQGLFLPRVGSTKEDYYIAIQDDRKEYIQYFDHLLNIKVNNNLVYQDIVDELNQISKVGDIANFKEYVKDNLKSVEVEYLTGLQKFMRLSKLFKEQSLSHISKYIDQKAHDLRKKLQDGFTFKTREHLQNDNFEFKCMLTKGEPYFTDKELYILSKLDKHRIHRILDDSYLLEYEILDEYKKQSKAIKSVKAGISAKDR